MERSYRPRLIQALKMHLIVTTLGVLGALVVLIFRGMFDSFVEDPVLAAAGLIVVGLLAGASVLAMDMLKYKKHSAREIGLTAEVFQIQLADGRRLEARWADIRSAASADLIWTIVTAQEKFAFSVAGLSYREQSDLARGITDMVAEGRDRT